MTNLRQKLNSQSGASIVIALIFFLVCLTVGAVVLTAATANAGRITRNQKEQQAYFAVRSAAELLRDELEGEAFTAKQDEWDGSPAQAGAANFPKYLTPEYLPELMEDTRLRVLRETVQTQAKDFFQMQCSGRTLPNETKFASFTIDAGEDIPKVEVSWWIDGSYGLHFSLDTAAADTGKDYHCPMTLTFSASPKYEVGSRTARWEVPHTEGEGEDAVTVMVERTAAYTRHTLEVSWNTGIITKGAGG